MLQEMIKRGVLFQGVLVPCFSHTKADVDFFIEAMTESLEVKMEVFIPIPILMKISLKNAWQKKVQLQKRPLFEVAVL